MHKVSLLWQARSPGQPLSLLFLLLLRTLRVLSCTGVPYFPQPMSLHNTWPMMNILI